MNGAHFLANVRIAKHFSSKKDTSAVNFIYNK